MPTSQKFASRGAGNGFPFCPEKVDVSVPEITLWTTLSGWSKESTPANDEAKAQSISESLANAMKLFWNFNGASADSYNSGDAIIPPVSYQYSIDMDAGDYDYLSFRKLSGGSDLDNKTPSERACYRSFFAGSVGDSFSLQVRIVRMYDGATTSEDNFVGYGADYFCESYGLRLMASLFLVSHVDADFSDAEEYVAIGGMHFVGAVWEGFPPDTITITSTSSSVTAEAETTGVNAQTERVTITGLDFYTY